MKLATDLSTDRDIYEAFQAYRHAPHTPQSDVVAAYEAAIEAVLVKVRARIKASDDITIHKYVKRAVRRLLR